MVNGEGLVGRVVAVESDAAQVDLITDSSMGVSARIGTSSATGLVVPKVGEPNNLLMRYLPPNTVPTKGELVVTSGTVAPPDDSLYPPGLVIGQVTSFNEESAYTSVNVRPAADLHNLDVVDVLTSGAEGHVGRLSTILSNLPASQTPGAQTEQLASTGTGG